MKVKDYIRPKETRVIWLFARSGRLLKMFPSNVYNNCDVIDNISTGNVVKLMIDERQVKK